MFRRVSIAFAGVAVVVLAACGSTPAAPAISDPKDILVKAVEAVQGAKSVHFTADIGGTVTLDLAGSGTGSPLDLSGTTAEGDLDMAGGDAKVSFTAPALLGLHAEVIIVGKDTYTKISLLGSNKYQKSTSSGADNPLDTVGDPKKALADLRKGLDTLPSPPVKAPDEKCGDQDCYRVTIPIPETDTGGALGGVLGGALGSAAPNVKGSGSVDVWVRKSDLRPAKLAITADAGSQGKLTVTVELSKWDESFAIAAPPADQVEVASPAP